MGRRLPVKTPPPTVDATRRRLGGRATTEGGAGELVRVVTSVGVEKDAVVLFVHGNELDVWIGEDTVLRTQRSRTSPGHVASSPALRAVAADARVFGSLHEGQRVRYQHGDGSYEEGSLVEKCRFGALVLRDDATIVGVGFRRIWPLVSGQEQN